MTEEQTKIAIARLSRKLSHSTDQTECDRLEAELVEIERSLPVRQPSHIAR